MKLIARTLTSLLLPVVYLAGNAYGQVTSSVIKVNIPFEFSVGDKTFAPGDYSLIQPLQHFLVLRDASGRTVASAFTHEVDASGPLATPKLRFASVGGQRILTELWQQQYPTGQRLIGSNARVRVAKHLATEARERAAGSQP